MRKPWMDQPHEFREDLDDYSMCICGLQGDFHDEILAAEHQNRSQ